jgi:hypothetical protein
LFLFLSSQSNQSINQNLSTIDERFLISDQEFSINPFSHFQIQIFPDRHSIGDHNLIASISDLTLLNHSTVWRSTFHTLKKFPNVDFLQISSSSQNRNWTNPQNFSGVQRKPFSLLLKSPN